MSKRKPEGKSITVLLVANVSEFNDEEQHMVIEFVPARWERMLLELCDCDPENFLVQYDRGANCDAIALYLAETHGDSWEPGNPLSTKLEDELEDEDVVEYLRKRRERRRAAYAFVVETDHLEEDAETRDTAMVAYNAYVKQTLRQLFGEGNAKLIARLKSCDLLEFARTWCGIFDVPRPADTPQAAST